MAILKLWRHIRNRTLLNRFLFRHTAVVYRWRSYTDQHYSRPTTLLKLVWTLESYVFCAGDICWQWCQVTCSGPAVQVRRQYLHHCDSRQHPVCHELPSLSSLQSGQWAVTNKLQLRNDFRGNCLRWKPRRGSQVSLPQPLTMASIKMLYVTVSVSKHDWRHQQVSAWRGRRAAGGENFVAWVMKSCRSTTSNCSRPTWPRELDCGDTENACVEVVAPDNRDVLLHVLWLWVQWRLLE